LFGIGEIPADVTELADGLGDEVFGSCLDMKAPAVTTTAITSPIGKDIKTVLNRLVSIRRVKRYAYRMVHLFSEELLNG
jgi:hypothetical protein